MNCAKARETLSAALDGEAAARETGELARHLEGCEHCSGWADRAHLVTRRVRLQAAPRLAVPADVLAAARRQPAPGRRPGVLARPARAARAGLVALGIAQLVVAVLLAAALAAPAAGRTGLLGGAGALDAATAAVLLWSAFRRRRRAP